MLKVDKMGFSGIINTEIQFLKIESLIKNQNVIRYDSSGDVFRIENPFVWQIPMFSQIFEKYG
jgi:hypothetical protein